MFFLIITITLLILLAMLLRSLVHQLDFNYPRTKERIKKVFGVDIDDQWWNPALSWKNKYNIKWTIDIFGFRWITKVMVQFSDAFHTLNTIELGCYDLIISILLVSNFGLAWWWTVIIFLFIGLALMGGVFAIAYDNLWQEKK